MKHFLILSLAAFLITSCAQVGENHIEKSEHHFGTIESGDAKSNAMDALNAAYVANDMSGQLEIFTEDAIARVNGNEMTPAQMMEGFLQGRNFYSDITNSEYTTATFYVDNGNVFTNTWFLWEGKSNATGAVVSSPVHASFKWQEDKVAVVNFLYDSHDYIVNMESK